MENNRAYPRDVAIRYYSHKITYAELFRQIDRCADALSAIGVQPGEIVTVALPSIPEALYLVYALNKLGAVANMIHPLAGKQEIIHYLNEVNSRVAFLFDGTYQIIRNAIGQTGVSRAVIVTAGDSLPLGLKQLYTLKAGKPKPEGQAFMLWKQFMALSAGVQAPVCRKDPHTVAVISHTGGTTGEPKGCMLSDRNINAEIWQIGHVLPVIRQESQLAVLPPFINYSLVNAMLEPIALGNTSILIPSYEPLMLVAYVKKFRPKYISSIPPYWEALLKIPSIEKYDLSVLEFPIYGGEAMNPETEEAVNAALRSCGVKNGLSKGLGATELVSAATLTPISHNIVKSAGCPLPKINCKIVLPETETEKSYGEEGEICFSGPTVMLGYYKNQAATNEIIKIHADGQRWLHTGDLGHMDENGVLYVTGRIKRIFMTKGRDRQITKVFPDRIEGAVAHHPAVDLCCAIAVPDAERINYPKVFIVLKEGAAPSPSIRQEILQCCREQLPEYMIPEALEFVDDLPRTERGKVDYHALEKMESARA